jgi:hypothetical protein
MTNSLGSARRSEGEHLVPRDLPHSKFKLQQDVFSQSLTSSPDTKYYNESPLEIILRFYNLHILAVYPKFECLPEE